MNKKYCYFITVLYYQKPFNRKITSNVIVRAKNVMEAYFKFCGQNDVLINQEVPPVLLNSEKISERDAEALVKKFTIKFIRK